MPPRQGTGSPHYVIARVMDPVSIATALIGVQAAQAQLAVAAKIARMGAQEGQAIANLLDAAAANFNRLANVGAGIGGNLDVTV